MHRIGVRAHADLVVRIPLVLVAGCDSPTGPSAPTDPVSIQTTHLAEAVEGQRYSQRLQATGGGGESSRLLAAGSLPSGLTLSSAATPHTKG